MIRRGAGLLLAALLHGAAAPAWLAAEPDQTTVAFLSKASTAFARGNRRAIERMVLADRAGAYEAVDSLLGADDPGGMPLAEALSDAYARVFDDRSLLERSAVFRAWTPRQRAARREAGELKTHAKAAMLEGRAEESTEGYERALAIYRELGDLREEGRCRSNLGAVAVNRGEMRRALEILDGALPVIRRAGDRNMIGVVEVNRAYALDEIGRADDALAALEAALLIAHETRDRQLETRVLVNRGALIMNLGRIEEASAAFQAAAEAGERAGDFELAGTAWHNVASIDRLRGDTASQERHLRLSLEAGRKGGLPPVQVEALLQLAPVRRRQGDRPGDRRLLDQCRTVLERIDDPIQHAHLAFQEALHLLAQDRLREALPFLDAAERGLEGLDQAGRLSAILGTRASALYYLGDYEGALAHIRRALEKAREGGRHDVEADNHATLGYFLHVLGDTPAAVAELQMAADMHGRLGDVVSRGTDLDALGVLRFRSGDLAGARAALEEALASLPDEAGPVDRAEVLKDLALVELASGSDRLSKGRTLLEQAREAFGRAGDRSGLLEAGLIEAQTALDASDLPGARAAMARIASDTRDHDTTEHDWKLSYLEGRLAEGSGLRARAVAAYRRSVAEVERLRGGVRRAVGRAAILDDRVLPYRALVRLLRDQGRAEEAYRIARSAKARTFVESLSPPDVEIRSTASDDDGRVVPASLSRSPGSGRAPAHATPISSDRLRSLLREGEVLLDFHLDGAEMTVFILDRVRLSVKRSHLDEGVMRGVDAARWPGRPRPEDASVTAAWRSASRRIGSALFEPIAPEIETARTLLIVPAGALHGVPLPALEFRGRPLFEHAGVTLLPAAEALLSRARRGGPGGLLAMGDPETDGETRLPSAGEEVRAVTAGGRDGHLLIGVAATEAAFRRFAPDADRIHLAAHGRVDTIAPSRSSVALASGGGEDGRLEASEIASLRLAASLVVLSGCGTGVEGGLARGNAPADERMGLPRAFLTAGAGAVVAGLWEMEDDAASAIMPRLYPKLAARGAAGALADLQRELAAGRFAEASGRRFDHPYYWAGLVAYGAGLGGGAETISSNELR